jgi:hypothetical protein
MDLCVEYREKRYIIEIKLIYEYSKPARVEEQGLAQVNRGRGRIDPEAPAYLVLFDRREEAKKTAWEERLGWEVRGGATVVRC